MFPKMFPFFSRMRTKSSARIKMITITGTTYEVLIHLSSLDICISFSIGTLAL